MTGKIQEIFNEFYKEQKRQNFTIWPCDVKELERQVLETVSAAIGSPNVLVGDGKPDWALW